MELGEFIKKVCDSFSSNTSLWIVLLLALTSFVEVSKIKINPWSTIFDRLTHKLSDKMDAQQLEFSEKLDNQQIEIQELKNLSEDTRQEVIKNAIDSIRWEILNFANSLKQHRKHSEDEFHHVAEQHAKYIVLLEMIGDTNGVIDDEYAFIQRVHQNKLDKYFLNMKEENDEDEIDN